MGTKIAERLKTLRRNKGDTQDKIAGLLNVKRQTYGAWERELANPDAGTIVFLANYYNVDTDYILGKSDIPRKPENIYDIRIQNLPADQKRILDTILFELERSGKEQTASGE